MVRLTSTVTIVRSYNKTRKALVLTGILYTSYWLYKTNIELFYLYKNTFNMTDRHALRENAIIIHYTFFFGSTKSYNIATNLKCILALAGYPVYIELYAKIKCVLLDHSQKDGLTHRCMCRASPYQTGRKSSGVISGQEIKVNEWALLLSCV